MKTIEERVEALEEKVLILERRKDINPYKTDSTKESKAVADMRNG